MARESSRLKLLLRRGKIALKLAGGGPVVARAREELLPCKIQGQLPDLGTVMELAPQKFTFLVPRPGRGSRVSVAP